MYSRFIHLLAQLEGDPGAQAADAANEAGNQGGGGLGLGFFIPMMLALLVMMLLMRPKKPDQENQKRLSDLKKNDRVVTAGGIIGTVLAIRDDNNSVTLRIDESTNTKMQVLQSSIIKVITDEKPEKT
ncbi:MAG: preprotein translocase subunit YajC [Pirellulaceae bacterium]